MRGAFAAVALVILVAGCTAPASTSGSEPAAQDRSSASVSAASPATAAPPAGSSPRLGGREDNAERRTGTGPAPTALAELPARARAAGPRSAVRGTVRTPSGVPLGRVRVSAFQPGPSCCRTVATAFTDIGGRYALSLAGGQYYVAFHPPAESSYVPTWLGDSAALRCSLLWCGGLGGRVLSVAGDVSDLDVELVPGHLVRGVVTAWPEGEPIGSITVTAHLAADHTPCPPCSALAGQARTASDGRFALALPPGSYRFHFEPAATYAAGWCCRKPSSAVADVLAVATDVAIEMELETIASVGRAPPDRR